MRLSEKDVDANITSIKALGGGGSGGSGLDLERTKEIHYLQLGPVGKLRRSPSPSSNPDLLHDRRWLNIALAMTGENTNVMDI